MTKPDEYRVVNDRIITEEKYQSEQSSAAFGAAAEKWRMITIVAADRKLTHFRG